jgi:hypothetical protein
MKLRASVFLFSTAVLIACSSGSGTPPSTVSDDSAGVGTCASGLDLSRGGFTGCSLATNVCAFPQELCRLETSAGYPSSDVGQCVCDPRRVDDPDPGNPDCLKTSKQSSGGNSCVSSADKCRANGGFANGDVGCPGSEVCCAGFITSPNDPGCDGANIFQGQCVDSDDNSLPSICCKHSHVAGPSGGDGGSPDAAEPADGSTPSNDGNSPADEDGGASEDADGGVDGGF